MQLFIRTVTGRVHTLEVEHDDTVDSVKLQLEYKQGIPVNQQRLTYQDQQLEDGYTLDHYNIPRETDLWLVLRLRGGMFHVSSGSNEGSPVKVTCALGTVTLRFHLSAGSMADLHRVFMDSRTLFMAKARSQQGDEAVDALDKAFDWQAPYNHAHWAIDESQWNYGNQTLEALGVKDGSTLAYGQ